MRNSRAVTQQTNATEAKTGLVRKLSQWVRGGAVLVVAGMMAAAPVHAQDVESFDPDVAYAAYQANGADAGGIDADLANPDLRQSAETAAQNAAQDAASDLPAIDRPSNPLPNGSVPVDADDAAANAASLPGFEDEFAQYSQEAGTAAGEVVPEWSDPQVGEQVAAAEAADPGTYGQDDLIGAAEGVFGKGAQGVAGMIEDLLREQGEPNGYIVGREGGGAFIFGVRYGSGTLHHRIEGERKVYWTGPSIGFDAGANAGNTFVLVYNLYDTEDIFRRYPAGEGQAYFVGGLHASYMRRGDVVLIPIRVGAGVRLGINAGYMRFSKKQRWLPF